MTTGDGPTGIVTTNDGDDWDVDVRSASGRLKRWLRPGQPRPRAGVLMLLALAASFTVSGSNQLLVAAPLEGAGQLLRLLPSLGGAAGGLALAAFVLAGSPASRVLGSLVAVGALAQVAIPLALYWATLASTGIALAAYLTAALLNLAVIVALTVPNRETRNVLRSNSNEPSTDTSQ